MNFAEILSEIRGKRARKHARLVNYSTDCALRRVERSLGNVKKKTFSECEKMAALEAINCVNEAI